MTVQTIVESLGVTFIQYLLDVILLICSGLFICILRKLLTRINVNLSEAEYEQLTSLVNTVVNATNQTITENIKAASENGKLTPAQSMEIFETVKEVIVNSLTDTQKTYIEKKYQSLDEGLRYIIEDAVAKAKQNRIES